MTHLGQWFCDPAHVALALLVIGPSLARLGAKTGWKWCQPVSDVCNEAGTDLVALFGRGK